MLAFNGIPRFAIVLKHNSKSAPASAHLRWTLHQEYFVLVGCKRTQGLIICSTRFDFFFANCGCTKINYFIFCHIKGSFKVLLPKPGIKNSNRGLNLPFFFNASITGWVFINLIFLASSTNTVSSNGIVLSAI